MLRLLFSLSLMACGSPIHPLLLSLPVETDAADADNVSYSIGAVNDAFGCPVISARPSADAKALGRGVLAFAYSDTDQEILFNEEADGFYDRQKESVLLFPKMFDIKNGVDVGENIERRQILHELGHMFGLQHTDMPGDIMNPSTSQDHVDQSVAQYVSSLRDIGVVCQ